MKIRRFLVVVLWLFAFAAPVWGDDLAAFVDPLKTRAAQGEAEAQNNLGLRYYKGQGVPQDDAEALKWFRLAAAQGNASAQTSLGVMYSQGNGVPQDYAAALKWYRLAAAQGDAKAQFNVGFMYYEGLGVPQDQAMALNLYREGAGIQDELLYASVVQVQLKAKDETIGQLQGQVQHRG